MVDEQVQGCAGCEEGAMRYNLLERLVKEEYRPQFTTAYVMPTPEPVKMRSDRFVARFNFKVNRYELLPNLGNNRVEFARVDSVAQVILRNSDVQVKNVTIDGYASPEGTDAGNLKLSQIVHKPLSTISVAPTACPLASLQCVAMVPTGLDFVNV